MNSAVARKVGEAGLWIAFAAIAYYFSFEFDKEVQIYRFGAAGWPRAVIVLIVIAALCQAATVLLAARRAAAEADRVPRERAAREGPGDEETHDRLSGFRIAAILVLPLIYAGLMEQMGFYFLTPFFILAFLLLAGERRWQMLVGVSLGIYVFMVIVFGRFLYINLPVGNWHPFYDFSNWLLVLIR